MNDYFLIAKVISVYGREGYVSVRSYSDFPERFDDLSKVYIDFFNDKKEFFVEKVLRKKDSFLIKFRNFDNGEDCKILTGKEIFVDKENLYKLPEGHYYVHDLIGSTVYRNDVVFGKIKDVLPYPANDVYVIDDNGKEILIPASFEFIESFDPEKKILILKPGDDFYEDDEI